MSFIFYLFLTLFLFLTMFLVFVILIQESKTMGLGSSFGGDSSDSLFGTSTADVLKKITGYTIAIFMISCVVLSLWTSVLGRVKQAPIIPMIEEAQR